VVVYLCRSIERKRYLIPVCHLSLLVTPPLKVFTDTTAHLHITSTPPDYRAARSQLITSQKVLAENECVISDLRDVMSVWCAEGMSCGTPSPGVLQLAHQFLIRDPKLIIRTRYSQAVRRIRSMARRYR